MARGWWGRLGGGWGGGREGGDGAVGRERTNVIASPFRSGSVCVVSLDSIFMAAGDGIVFDVECFVFDRIVGRLRRCVL